jgi:hypothetical protein
VDEVQKLDTHGRSNVRFVCDVKTRFWVLAVVSARLAFRSCSSIIDEVFIRITIIATWSCASFPQTDFGIFLGGSLFQYLYSRTMNF